MSINYRDEAIVEEEADEAGGDAAVHADLIVDDVADGALGVRARLAIEPNLQAVDDRRVDGAPAGCRRKQGDKEQQPRHDEFWLRARLLARTTGRASEEAELGDAEINCCRGRQA